ncbi:MAG: NAD+ kinase [Candidatus Peregrinibacteria bacterium Gr01-1014_25]|nr:MAG: NAD+ kinase [Candidatus Peregrinibacteria bacterium Gr01-1014_25]
MKMQHRIGLVVKPTLTADDAAVQSTCAVLDSLGLSVHVEESCPRGIGPSGAPRFSLAAPNVDTLLVLGGDGTIFRTVRRLGDLSIPILGINRGGVGFLAEIDADDAQDILPRLLGGQGIVEERSLLEIRAERAGAIVFQGHALNEAVIAQGALARLLDLETSVQGEPLTTYRADGLIIATPTGSTAYSLSAGGPIVHPRMQAIILTPLNPHTFSQKPIVIPEHHRVTIAILAREQRSSDMSVGLTLDGQEYIPLQWGDRVHVAAAAGKARFLRRAEDTFFATLRRKLKWGERP